jgi:hypothetical protein
LISHSSEDWKYEIQVPAAGFLRKAFFMVTSSHGLLWCMHAERVPLSPPFSIRDISQFFITDKNYLKEEG